MAQATSDPATSPDSGESSEWRQSIATRSRVVLIRMRTSKRERVTVGVRFTRFNWSWRIRRSRRRWFPAARAVQLSAAFGSIGAIVPR